MPPSKALLPNNTPYANVKPEAHFDRRTKLPLDFLAALDRQMGGLAKHPNENFRPVLEHTGWTTLKGWRFDVAWPAYKVAVEIDGGVWLRGRHNRGGGFIEDCRKLNEAARLGWIVLRGTPELIADESLPSAVKYVLEEIHSAVMIAVLSNSKPAKRRKASGSPVSK